MKKNIYITITFILFVLFANAQTKQNDFDPYSNFGIRQGINYTSVLFSPGVEQGLQLGYTGGLVYKYQNQKRVGLQIELNYTQKGWKENLDTVSNSYSRTMDYIELPFMTHIVLGKKNTKFYINLGTTFGYLLSEKEDLVVKNESFRREYYEKEIEQKFDYSGLGELGLVIHSGIGQFQTGFRFQWTLTDLFETTSDTKYDQSQNLIIGFSVNYFFYTTK